MPRGGKRETPDMDPQGPEPLRQQPQKTVMPRGREGRPAGSSELVRWQEHAGSEVAPRCMPEPGAAVETERARDGATRGTKEIGG